MSTGFTFAGHRHGTYTAYVKSHCRCPECSEADRLYHREHNGSIPLAEYRATLHRTHGIRATYVHAHCRCEDCRRAEREYRRQYRARRAA